MAKEIRFGEEARKSLETGVNAVASSFAMNSGYSVLAGKITAGTDASSKFTIQKNMNQEL